MILPYEVVLGRYFIFFSIFMLFSGILYLWRGGRMNVEVGESVLIIRHYFSERKIPLDHIQQAYLSLDEIVVETAHKKIRIIDGMFADLKDKKVLLTSLPQALGKRWLGQL